MRIQFPSHERKAHDECEQAMLGETLLRKFEGAKLERRARALAHMRIQFPSHERKAHDECEQAMLGETLLRDFAEAKVERRTRALARMLVHLQAPD